MESKTKYAIEGPKSSLIFFSDLCKKYLRKEGMEDVFLFLKSNLHRKCFSFHFYFVESTTFAKHLLHSQSKGVMPSPYNAQCRHYHPTSVKRWFDCVGDGKEIVYSVTGIGNNRDF